jgi:hypothetical protein
LSSGRLAWEIPPQDLRQYARQQGSLFLC